MFEHFIQIPHFLQNVEFGATGAFLVELFKMQRILPDIQAIPRPGENFGWRGYPIKLVVLNIIVSLTLGALTAALLIRPQESYGAIATGMTWPTVLTGIIRKSRKG